MDNKIFFSSSDSHEDLQAEVRECDLPELYGGTCECDATCIYSEKGPWCDFENTIDYRNPDANKNDSGDGSDVADTDERNLGDLKMMLGMGGGNPHEEFKMQEDEDDNVDLLDEKTKSKDLSEFYAQNE